MSEAKKLNLGCGQDLKPGWTNMDANPGVGADVVHDMNHFPYPFETGSFDEILCKEILEHVEDVVKVMEEIHRILKPGGCVRITVPHYTCSNAYTDPTHKHFFGYRSFDYFTGDNEWGFYTRCRFRKVSVKIKFFGRIKNWPWEKLANWSPRFYEEHLAWILPAWYLAVTLEAEK